MEEKIIEGAEDFRKSETFSYKEIVLKQLQVVVNNTSKEMRIGFWIYSSSHPSQNPVKVKYIGDSRKELQRSLDCLNDLLLPKFDGEIKDKSKEVYESIIKYRADHQEMKRLSREFPKMKKTPEGKEIIVKDFDDQWKDLLQIYRKLFQELCLFLERLQWLDPGVREE